MADFAGGGAQRMMLHLAEGLAGRGVDTEIVVLNAAGPLRPLSPVAIVSLGRSRATRALWSLRRYLTARQPHVVLSTQDHMNVLAIAAGAVTPRAPLVWLRQSNASVHQWTRPPHLRERIGTSMLGLTCRRADLVLALNEEMRTLLERHHHVPAEKIEVLRNPVITQRTGEASTTAPKHRWLQRDRTHRVIVSVGRLTQQKDFPTLIDAFARISPAEDIRLVIFGEGEDRRALEELASSLGVRERIDLAGWSENPLAEVRASDVFALSSLWEGSPNALIEALYCGVPVVSTNCPTGPAEILDGGRFGRLVPVRDPAALAGAIESCLSERIDAALRREWVMERYGSEAVTDDLMRLLAHRVVGGRVPPVPGTASSDRTSAP